MKTFYSKNHGFLARKNVFSRQKFFLLFLLPLLTALLFSVPAEIPASADSSSITRIVCFGDSNTYGYCPSGNSSRYPEEELWTTLLSDHLGSEYEVINEGLNGRTTAYDYADSQLNGLSALPDCLSADMPVDILIFMLGTNDCANSNVSCAQDIADGMEQLLVAAEDITLEIQGYIPQIVLVVPAALAENHGYSSTFVERSRDIAPLYEDLAEKYDCLYLDASELLEVSEVDGVHLTAQGHRTLADLLYELLTQQQNTAA